MDFEETMQQLHDAWVNINGEFYRGSEATVSIWDRGFVYGDTVFEGVFVLDGSVVKLDEHLDRLWQSATFVDIDIPVSKAELRDRLIETVRKNDIHEGYVRPKVSRGEGPMGVSNTGVINERATPNVFVIPQFKSTALPEVVGTTGHLSSVMHRPPLTLDPRAKVGNYLSNILAEIEAENTDSDVPILVDQQGFIAEANTANLFVVRGDELLTPRHQSALSGITRRTVMELADSNGLLAPSAQDLTTYDLYTADELFITGTSAGIVGLTAVNGREINGGEVGPKTTELAALLYEHLIETGTPATG